MTRIISKLAFILIGILLCLLYFLCTSDSNDHTKMVIRSRPKESYLYSVIYADSVDMINKKEVDFWINGRKQKLYSDCTILLSN
jgi:hypothetical protein